MNGMRTTGQTFRRLSRATARGERRLSSATLALAGALVITACAGGGNDTAAGDSGSAGHNGGHSASTDPTSSTAQGDDARGNDADVSFLTQMKPHHEQAVVMSDLVLAANPPAPVAELARQVKAAQAPEIQQMEQMLADLGQPAETGDGAHAQGHGHGGGHGGMMTDAEMDALMGATGTDAARMYLEGMIEHHRGAIEAAEAQVADGQHQPAVELARRIAEEQAAEIEELEAVLASL